MRNDTKVSAVRNEQIKRDNNDIKSKTTFIRLPDLSHYSFREILERSPTIEEYCEQHKDEKWKCMKFDSHDPNSEEITYAFGSVHYIKKEDPKDLYRIIKSEKIYSSGGEEYEGDILIYYSGKENAITVILRSSDIFKLIRHGSEITRGERGWDEANIKIYLDENHDRLSSINYMTTEMSLSRTAISMLLEDAGIDRDFENLYKALKCFLVLRRANNKRRTIEKNDCKIVPLRIVSKINRCLEKASPQDIKVLEDFHYYKSRSVRQLALSALGRVADAGGISKERFKISEMLFEFHDIDEDILFIERMLVQEPLLMEKVLSGVSCEKIPRDKVDRIMLKWLGNGKNKNIYTMEIFLKDGSIFSLAVSAIRHDPLGLGFKYDDIERAGGNWIMLSEKDSESVPKVFVQTWIHDYKPRIADIAISGSRMRNDFDIDNIGRANWIYNHIQLVFREYVKGEDLESALSGQDVGNEEKTEMKRAALQACLDIWNDSKDKKNPLGFFLGDPKPANIVIFREGNRYRAKVIDLDALKELDRLIDYLEKQRLEKLAESDKLTDLYKISRMRHIVNRFPEYSCLDIKYVDGRAVVVPKKKTKGPF